MAKEVDLEDKIRTIMPKRFALNKFDFIVINAIVAAGIWAEENQDENHETRKKSDEDFVSEADVWNQKTILDAIHEFDPNIRVDSEESHLGQLDHSQGRILYLDPLDGTTNYVKGKPHYAVALAEAYNGILRKAYIYLPEESKLYLAKKGRGLYEIDMRDLQFKLKKMGLRKEYSQSTKLSEWMVFNSRSNLEGVDSLYLAIQKKKVKG